jgi:hypothetical protein
MVDAQILHQYENTITKRRSRVPIKGTPTGNLWGCPRSMVSNSLYVLVQDVRMVNGGSSLKPRPRLDFCDMK